MNWGMAIAVLAAMAVITTILGIWRLSETRRTIRDRLGYRARSSETDAGIFRTNLGETGTRWLTTLLMQAGYDNARPSAIFLVIAA